MVSQKIIFFVFKFIKFIYALHNVKTLMPRQPFDAKKKVNIRELNRYF